MKYIYILVSLILIFNLISLIIYYNFPTDKFNCFIINNEFTTIPSCLRTCGFEVKECVNRTLIFETKTTYPDISYSVKDIIILIFSSILLIIICFAEN